MNLFINNVPLLKPRNQAKYAIQAYTPRLSELELGKSYKFNIIEVFDDIDGLLLMTARMFQFKETFIEITKLLKVCFFLDDSFETFCVNSLNLFYIV